MLTDTITKLPQKIVNFFEKETERLGKLTKYKQRHSKLTSQSFIKALLTASFCPHFDLEILSERNP